MTATGPGGWLRPVSDRPSQEVSEHERQYPDGGDPKLLDVVDVPLLEPRPHGCQTENWLLNPTEYWKRVGKANWDDLQQYVENPVSLSANEQSTYHGLHDEMPVVQADGFGRSLYLVNVAEVELRVFAPSASFGDPKRKVRARFRHNDVWYDLMITDPVVERERLAGGDGTHSLGECCLTVSLSEPFTKANHPGESFRYKLVAAIIPRE